MSEPSLHESAPTRFQEIGDVRLAYRRFGKEGAPPLVCLQHFSGTMNNFDPIHTNRLAKDRPVVLVDYLGADIAIDYKKDDFADVLRDYDVVLHSLDKVTLEKSLRVLKPGGQLISISGPPDAAFARSIGASWVLRMIMGALSYGVAAKAKRRHAQYSFLFMRANGGQLTKITALIDDGIIRRVVDRVLPFASTKEAMAYVEAGRAKGKIVVSLQ